MSAARDYLAAVQQRADAATEWDGWVPCFPSLGEACGNCHRCQPPAALVAVGPTIAAQVLRDAANAADEDPEFRDPLRLKADWMRDRADTIEKEAGR